MGYAGFFNQLDHFAGGDLAGVRDIINAAGHPLFPAGEGCGDEFLQLRNGVIGFEERRVTQELSQVIARAIDLIKGNAQTPNVS